MKQRKKSHKIAVIALAALFFIYLGCNLIWGLRVYKTYSQFVPGMEEVHFLRTYAIQDEDGYTYNVKVPSYLSYTGNLGVQPPIGGDCALIIWPGITSETTYGLFLIDQNGDTHAIKLDKDRRLAEDESEYVIEVYEYNIDKVNDLFARADQMWSIE